MRWPKWTGSPGSRRAFLGGAAATVTLPYLASMHGARSAVPEPPVRLLTWFSPCGFYPSHFTVPVGPLGTLAPTLASLDGLQSELLMVSGLANRPAIRPFQGDHARGTGGTLTCRECIHHEDGTLENGISIDQVIAAEVGHQTPFASLEVGTTPSALYGACDVGFSCAYTTHISWSDASTPRPLVIEPDRLFLRLFSGSDDPKAVAEQARRRELRASVLDHVTADIAALAPQLATSDRSRLDAFLTAVRELEQYVLLPPPDEEAPEAGLDWPDRVRAMGEVMVLALQNDLTRVITFMAENGESYRYHDHLDTDRPHHDLSHHAGDPAKIEQLLRVEAWFVQEFAAVVQQLADAEDPYGGGSLLDNSVVMLTSELSDADQHVHVDLPMLLAGRAGGRIHPGRHVAMAPDTPLADFYITLASLMGVTVPTFGRDGTGPLDLGDS